MYALHTTAIFLTITFLSYLGKRGDTASYHITSVYIVLYSGAYIILITACISTVFNETILWELVRAPGKYHNYLYQIID